MTTVELFNKYNMNNRKDYREAFVKEPLPELDWNNIVTDVDYSSLYPTDGEKFILKDE